MNFSCPYCGGSRLEHLRSCPKLYSIVRQNQFNQKAKKDYFGSSPNLFVGSYGYPQVNVGIFSNEELPQDADAPRTWAAKSFTIPQVVDIRSSLINSRFVASVKSFDQKYLDIAKEVAMAKKPVDVEVHLDRKPYYSIRLDNDITPYGPAVGLEKAQITENPKISTHVEKIVDDTDLRATEGLSYLYTKGYDEHQLTKLISAGNLGMAEKRRLVPTRWSITAVDDTLGKQLIHSVKEYPEYEFVAHFGGYLGNNYIIMFLPQPWSYELFETYIGDPSKPAPGEIETSTDYEPYSGRTGYAKNTVGGYYATRLAILEYLKTRKRQASVLALRFITNEYYMALGVWVVREAVRAALRSPPIRFGDRSSMLRYAKDTIRERFSFELAGLTSRSRLLRQSMLSQW